MAGLSPPRCRADSSLSELLASAPSGRGGRLSGSAPGRLPWRHQGAKGSARRRKGGRVTPPSPLSWAARPEPPSRATSRTPWRGVAQTCENRCRTVWQRTSATPWQENNGGKSSCSQAPPGADGQEEATDLPVVRRTALPRDGRFLEILALRPRGARREPRRCADRQAKALKWLSQGPATERVEKLLKTSVLDEFTAAKASERRGEATSR